MAHSSRIGRVAAERGRVGGCGIAPLLLYSAALLTAACRGGTSRSSDSVRGLDSAGARVAVPAPTSPIRVVFVGTSLTAGLGLEPDSAYPARIQRKADSSGVSVHVVNAGVSGETSAGALRRIDWVLREPADLVVIETGANDGLRALRVDSTRANLEAIVRRVRAARPSARVVLVQMEAPSNLGSGYTSAFHAMFPSVARQERVDLVPFLLSGVAGIDSLNQADGVHPNDAGERRVADTVWGSLAPLLRAIVAERAGRSAAAG